MVLGTGCNNAALDREDARVRAEISTAAARVLAGEQANGGDEAARAREGLGRAQPRVIEAPAEDDLPLAPGVRETLEGMAGPGSYAGANLPLDEDLLGRPGVATVLGLDRAVRATVAHNLAGRGARFAPAAADERVRAAEAAFDWVLFADGNWQAIDEPNLVPVIAGVPVGSFATQRQRVSSTAGLRRATRGGGTLTVQQALGYTDDSTPGLELVPDPSSDLAVSVDLRQPLLRGAGAEVNEAEIELGRNARAAAVAELALTLNTQAAAAQREYWRLAEARAQVLIAQRLLERGVTVREQLRARAELDAPPAQTADATARVERRRADVLRAQTALRLASDRLKALMNDPELPLGDEALLLPAEAPVLDAVRFSLGQSVRTALDRRPEIARSLASLADTEVRQRVARNGVLPRLDARAGAALLALEDDPGSAYGQLDGRFVDYLVGLAFEQPLGNRGPEAQLRAARLERLRAANDYRRVLQEIILDVRAALTNLSTSARLVAQTRASRVAAAENLRTLEVESRTTGTRSVERLDLELNRQEALAAAERDEIAALVGVQLALVDLDLATGAVLDRFGLRLRVPSTDELLTQPGEATDAADDHSGEAPQPAGEGRVK